jgi:hypothetical protein
VEDKMANYKISEENIIHIKRKYLFFSILGSFIAVISGFTIVAIRINDLNIIGKIIIPFVLIVGAVLYFSIKFFGLKPFINSALSLVYTIGNDRFIIRYNDHERLNISRNDIKQIIHYKNNTIMLYLANNKKIYLNKNMENYDSLISELGTFCDITDINKNPSKILNVFTIILSAGIMCILLLSKNFILVMLSGIIVIIFFVVILVYTLLNKNIDKKTKRTLLFLSIVIIYIVVDKVLKLI